MLEGILDSNASEQASNEQIGHVQMRLFLTSLTKTPQQ